MPAVRAPLRGGDDRRGGILGYPLGRLQEEVAFVAYHFHWSLEEILNLEHADRRGWVQQISDINQQMNDQQPA